jgi:predicted subunit of tRNA(5-methylaminomethyl-2-thiouridylate) methyltransferase
MNLQEIKKNKKVHLLFSGGKDSSLAAIILSKFFEVELITCTFRLLTNWRKAEEVAKKLKMSFKTMELPEIILEEASEKIIKDNFPANGIKLIHKKALERLAETSEFIADGVRRDDRVPVLSLAEIKQIEDKFNVHYLQPLMGYSRKTINLLVGKFFIVKEYKSEEEIGAEYEFELREFIKRKYGSEKIKKIFPKNHTHSIIIKLSPSFLPL